jgi:hypothetical protein
VYLSRIIFDNYFRSSRVYFRKGLLIFCKGDIGCRHPENGRLMGLQWLAFFSRVRFHVKLNKKRRSQLISVKILYNVSWFAKRSFYCLWMFFSSGKVVKNTRTFLCVRLLWLRKVLINLFTTIKRFMLVLYIVGHRSEHYKLPMYEPM